MENDGVQLFFEKASNEKQVHYSRLLAAASSLTRIFSESSSPYLSSRSVENIFCYAFDAENLSRSDCSVDAKYQNIGVGIKTFLHNNGNTLQKIAEFNKDIDLYRGLEPLEMIEIIARLRNARLGYTQRTYKLDSIIYHCVTRKDSKLYIFEECMDYIEVDKISKIKKSGPSIKFSDGKNDYSFHISKSTLFKRFVLNKSLAQVDITIIDNPFKVLIDFIEAHQKKAQALFLSALKSASTKIDLEYVVLPLYSLKSGMRVVNPKSGLNIWNAAGRKRHSDEVYIQIRSIIHKRFKGFFPGRDTSFNLILPSGKVLCAKVCQQNSKALMSNPNRDLGKWILRDVLNLEDGVVVTYKHLTELGIDSVKITKKDDLNFYIDFCGVDTYEEFEDNYIKN